MNETSQEQKYQNLKKIVIKAVILALVIFVFEAFMLGAPVFSVLIVIYLLLYLYPATLFRIRNKPAFRFYGSRALIYTILVVSSIGFHNFDVYLGKKRGETVIAAIEKYHDDKGSYPGNLQNLVPEYLAEIPKPRIAPGIFYYQGAPDDPHLMFTSYAPFGRLSWSFKDRKWTEIGD